jgi:1,4-alpha-glucan branching enzyme
MTGDFLMTRFRVWAPLADRVQLVHGEARHPMTAGERGWWSADVPRARADTDYAFVVDGGEPLPDPRSPWQPRGVHGPSRLVDHAAFPWTDTGWQPSPLASAVMHELHVGTFTPAGTFEANTILTGERDGYYADFGTLADLAKALERAFVYDGRYSVFRRRRHGKAPGGLPGHRFVVCLQNHDQVGNRARGERVSHLVGAECLKVGAALLLTAPFIPLLLQGQEWAASAPFQYFTDHDDPELGRAVSEGRRNEFAAFGWKPEDVPDPQSPQTFARSKLDWSEPGREPHASLLDWHRQLLRLRRELPRLGDGGTNETRARFDEAARWLAVERGPVTVACNLGLESARVPVQSAAHHVRLASDPRVKLVGAGVELPAPSVAVLVADAHP